MGAVAIYGRFFGQTQPYYSRHPKEPPPPAKPSFEVTTFSPATTPHMTLEQVLDGILASTAKDVLIVSHGAGNGINLNVGAAPLLQEIVNEINNELCGRTPRTIPYIPYGSRRATPIAITQQLLDKVRRVQAISLERVYIRACQVGNDTLLIDSFATLLNCKTISAPKLKSVYASTRPIRLDTAAFDRWARGNRRHTTGTAGSRIGYELIVNPNHTVQFNLRVEGSTETDAMSTLRTWVDSKFYFSNTSFLSFSSISLVIECLYSDATHNMYFPKDPDYESNMNTLSPSRTNWCAPIVFDDSLPFP